MDNQLRPKGGATRYKRRLADMTEDTNTKRAKQTKRKQDRRNARQSKKTQNNATVTKPAISGASQASFTAIQKKPSLNLGYGTTG